MKKVLVRTGKTRDLRYLDGNVNGTTTLKNSLAVPPNAKLSYHMSQQFFSFSESLPKTLEACIHTKLTHRYH